MDAIKFLLFIIFTLCSSIVFAQDDEPRFPGCSDHLDYDCADMKMMQFVISNINHPTGNPGGESVAVFMVKASGELTDIKVIESISPDCDKELIRVISKMPKWLPAHENGVPIDMEWELVVKFRAK